MAKENSKKKFIIIAAVAVVVVAAVIGVLLYFNRPPSQRIADEIAFGNKEKTCSYKQVLPKNATITDLQHQPLANFVALAKEVTKRPECAVFVYTAYATLTLDFKSYEEKKILEFTLNSENKAAFDSYNWNDLEGETVGVDLQEDKILTTFADDIGEFSLNSLRYYKDKVSLK